jgi:hypothetical protein
VKLLTVTVSVEAEPGVVASHSFHVRADLDTKTSVARHLEAVKLATAQVVRAFWTSYRTITQPPAVPPQRS